jgi:hypothetical protein
VDDELSVEMVRTLTGGGAFRPRGLIGHRIFRWSSCWPVGPALTRKTTRSTAPPAVAEVSEGLGGITHCVKNVLALNDAVRKKGAVTQCVSFSTQGRK